MRWRTRTSDPLLVSSTPGASRHARPSRSVDTEDFHCIPVDNSFDLILWNGGQIVILRIFGQAA